MKKQRIWTDEEDNFLREHYGKMTLVKMGEHLGRSKESVNKRMKRIGLREEMGRLRVKWTDEEDAFLKENINNMTNKEIGEHLNKVPSSVASRIRTLKLERENKLVRWTDEEDDYLLTHFGTKSIPNIAAKLGRTEVAVESRLNRLGVYGGKENTGYLSVYELAETLGIDTHTVYLWINKREMPYKRSIVVERKFYMVDVPSFWNWAEKNRDILNWNRIPKNALIPEPEWVEEQRKIDYYKRPKNENKNWTDKEDKRLWELYFQHGYTQKEVGEIMGRSRRSIQRRIGELVRSRKTG